MLHLLYFLYGTQLFSEKYNSGASGPTYSIYCTVIPYVCWVHHVGDFNAVRECKVCKMLCQRFKETLTTNLNERPHLFPPVHALKPFEYGCESVVSLPWIHTVAQAQTKHLNKFIHKNWINEFCKLVLSSLFYLYASVVLPLLYNVHPNSINFSNKY